MSIRLMLNGQAIVAAGGFVKNGTRGNAGARYLCCIDSSGLEHEAFIDDNGEPYINVDQMERLPDFFKEFVAGASERDYFGPPGSPDRRPGEYKYKSASAVLKRTQGSTRYLLEIFAKQPEDLVLLKGLILEGKVWPNADYEAEQVPPPLRQVGDLFRELWQIVRRDVSNKLYGIKTRFGN